MHRFLALAALGASVGLTGCGSNPTDKLDFKAPPGWTSTPSMFGAKVWIKGGQSKGEIVFLLDLAGKADPKLNGDIAKEIGSKGYSGGDIGVVEKSAKIKICGDHDAQYLEATANKNGQKSQTQILLTNWDKDMYVAVYSHPAGTPADPAGVAAIRSICPKK
jgi:hypothetical protein